MKKSTSQLDAEIKIALVQYRIDVRPVYARAHQMPTVGHYVAELSSLSSCRVRAFKRESWAAAVQAALDWADKHGVAVENRALIEAKIAKIAKEKP